MIYKSIYLCQSFKTVVRSVILLLVILSLVEVAAGEIIREGLVAEYHFEDNAIDTSGKGNNGAVHGATFIEGKNGKSLSFDGSNDCVKIPDSMSLNPVSGITLEVWIKVDKKTTRSHSILSKMEYLQESGYELYIMPKNKPRFSLISGGVKTRVDGSSIPSNSWTQIAGTYEGNTLVLYVNGKFEDYMEKPRFIFPSTRDYLWIGCWRKIDNFKGSIDEVRIYNRSLNDTEIKANYEAVMNPPPPTPANTTSQPVVTASPKETIALKSEISQTLTTPVINMSETPVTPQITANITEKYPENAAGFEISMLLVTLSVIYIHWKRR